MWGRKKKRKTVKKKAKRVKKKKVKRKIKKVKRKKVKKIKRIKKKVRKVKKKAKPKRVKPKKKRIVRKKKPVVKKKAVRKVRKKPGVRFICPGCGKEIEISLKFKEGKYLNCSLCDAELEMIKFGKKLDLELVEDNWEEEALKMSEWEEA